MKPKGGALAGGRPGWLPAWAGPVAFTSLLYWLTQPPFAFAFLPFVALVPWLAWLKGAEAKEARQSGAAFGVIYALTQMWFILVLLKNYTGSFWIGLIPYLVIALMGAAFFWGLAALIHACFQRGWWWLVPFIWTGSEVFRAFIGPIPFPWGILAHPLHSFPQLAQGAAGGTVFLVSAWCVLINLLAVYIFFPDQDKAKNPSGNALFRATVACLALAVFSLWRYNTPPPGALRLVTLGQPGVNLAYLRGEERRAAVDLSGAQLLSTVMAQGRTDLLLLPEGYAPGGSIPPYNPFGPEPPVPVIFGGSVREGKRTYQGAFAWDPAKAKWTTTAKERLVIFGETLPWVDFIPYNRWLDLGFKSFDPGKHQLLEVSGMKVGLSICYEGLFSDLTARYSTEGANLLAVISIDDWYVGTPAWDLLWQSTIWRAIESGLPVARSGGLGRSLAVDARGNLLTLVPPNQRLAARVEMRVPDSSDSFSYRMVFPWLCLASLAWPVFVLGREWVQSRAPEKGQPQKGANAEKE